MVVFMCGRFCFVAEKKVIEKRLNVQVPELFQPVYNAAPGQQLSLIANDDPAMLSSFRWGLVPYWAKSAAIGYKMINARVETVLEKPSYSKLFISRRCLIPMTGFFEWKTIDRKKIPFLIKMKSNEIFCCAGLWDLWLDKSTGEQLKTFTIMTTEPNDLVRNIHERMPVIISKDLEFEWLTDGLKIDILQTPYTSEEMIYVEVSQLVNSPKNNNSDILLSAN